MESGEAGEMPDHAGGSPAVLGLMKRSIASQTVGLREWDVFCREGSRMTPELMHFHKPNKHWGKTKGRSNFRRQF